MTSLGRWKLHIPHRYRHINDVDIDGYDGKYLSKDQELALYDIQKDPPELADKLKKRLETTKRNYTK